MVATEVACVDIRTQEDCFDSENVVAWYLLTSLPITTIDDVKRIVFFGRALTKCGVKGKIVPSPGMKG